MGRFRAYLKEQVARAIRKMVGNNQSLPGTSQTRSNNQSNSPNMVWTNSSTDRPLPPYCGDITPDPIMESVLISALPGSLSASRGVQTHSEYGESQPCSSSSLFTSDNLQPASSLLKSSSKVSPIAEEGKNCDKVSPIAKEINYSDAELQSSFSGDAIPVILVNHWASETQETGLQNGDIK